MKTDLNSLINKYAILISIFYLANILLSYFNLLTGAFWILSYFLTNIIIAFVISYDLKKCKIKSLVTIWSAIIFDILGVTLLFIQILRNEESAND